MIEAFSPARWLAIVGVILAICFLFGIIIRYCIQKQRKND